MIRDGLSLLRHRSKNRLVLLCWCDNKLMVQNNNKHQVYQVVTSQYQAILWVVSTELPDQCQIIRLLADCCNQESQLAMMVIGDCPQNPNWSFLEKNFCLGFCFIVSVLVSKQFGQILYQTLFWYCDNTNHHLVDIDGSCEDQLHQTLSGKILRVKIIVYQVKRDFEAVIFQINLFHVKQGYSKSWSIIFSF